MSYKMVSCKDFDSAALLRNSLLSEVHAVMVVTGPEDQLQVIYCLQSKSVVVNTHQHEAAVIRWVLGSYN